MGVIQIQITTSLTHEAYEKLEDALKKFLEEQGLRGTIWDGVTYNTTRFWGMKEKATLEVLYAKELKKPDDVKEVHEALEDIFGE